MLIEVSMLIQVYCFPSQFPKKQNSPSIEARKLMSDEVSHA